MKTGGVLCDVRSGLPGLKALGFSAIIAIMNICKRFGPLHLWGVRWFG